MNFPLPRITILLVISAALVGVATMTTSAQNQDEPEWIARSNENTRILLDVLARSSPEGAARLGVDGLDESISDFTPGFMVRRVEALNQARVELEKRLLVVEDRRTRQDLEILLTSADESLERIRLEDEFLLPYTSVSSVIYQGLRALLEDRIPHERRQAALARLQKYTGRADGFEPLTDLVTSYQKLEWTESDRLPPFKGQIERDLNTSQQYIDEIGQLFAQYGLVGYEDDFAALQEQIKEYNTYVRDIILPESRAEFQLPAPIYTFRLADYGVDMPVDELRRRASVEFEQLQDQMQALAFRIAEHRGFTSTDYRDVLRSLKKEQFVGDAILPFYQNRMAEIEDIIERFEIVTLPDRAMRIRLATEAESAASPAPFMSPPRLIGNTGEFGEFVLPVRLAGGSDGSVMQMDDFTYQAASWPLAAHEGRPGHELQYTSIVERGVSQARVIFARNSVNSEGWALYMEEQMLPYIPIEGQFATMWSRMVRAARAFLDPGLNMGLITRDEAERVLREDVVLSEALVRSEVERYTFRAPGQATSYFNGYIRLMELRAEATLILGDRFVQKEFHDFILAEGLLPLKMIRQSTLNNFIPSQLGAESAR